MTLKNYSVAMSLALITISGSILGCGIEGLPGEKGESGDNWARDDIYCSISDSTRNVGGDRFQLTMDCDEHDFPLSGACDSGPSENVRLVGGEHLYWQEVKGLEPFFACTFEWTIPPPYPSPLDSGAKAEICCIKNR